MRLNKWLKRIREKRQELNKKEYINAMNKRREYGALVRKLTPVF